MNIRIRTAAAAAVIAAVLPFAAACSNADQGTAERATSHTADTKSDDSAQDTAEQPADEPTEDAKPNTELAVGDAFRYNDGVKVTVTHIAKITSFGEYDDHPDANTTAFRVTWTVTNGTSKPVDLGSWSFNPQGATTGGETSFIYVENGSKEMTGRLAPDRTGTYTGEYSLAKADGNDVVVTVSRMDDAWMENEDAYTGDDPNWTGAIK